MITQARTGALSGAVTGWCVAQTPGALPRTTLLSALAGTVCAVVGLALGAALAALCFRRRPKWAQPARARRTEDGRSGQARAAAAPGIGAALVFAGALWWQATLRAAMGMPAVGPGWMVAAHRCGRPNSPANGCARGGLRQRAVVIAVPTGSGWVDAAAVRGFEERFAGSVRILAVQYSEVPSWQAYVRSPASAGESAIALLDAVVTTLRGHRPEVYLYGQSLGAIGADAARQWSAAHHHPLTGSVLVGYPGGHPAGVDPTRTVINNASDPVARLGFSLLWKPAASAAHQTENVPAPPWLPGLSALATVIDLFGSLDVPSGFGHRYGPEQAGESLPPALAGGTPDTATLDTAMPVP